MSQQSQTGEGIRTPALLDDLLAETSRTFALTIPLLPEPTRCEVTVAYLLFRVADTLEDAELWDRERKLSELDSLGAYLRRPQPGEPEKLAKRWTREPPSEHAGYRRLMGEFPAVMRSASELEPGPLDAITSHTLRTVEGMASFVAREEGGVLQLRDLDDLKAYCYAVAGIVGEMLTELFLRNRDSVGPIVDRLRRDAASFGEALQLLNILKDSATDHRFGRCYLPEGVDRAAVFALTRKDLEIAFGYCSLLENAEAPTGVVAFTALPVLLARATLDRVEADGPGAKLTRDEVGRIVADLQRAAPDRRVSALLNSK